MMILPKDVRFYIPRWLTFDGKWSHSGQVSEFRKAFEYLHARRKRLQSTQKSPDQRQLIEEVTKIIIEVKDV